MQKNIFRTFVPLLAISFILFMSCGGSDDSSSSSAPMNSPTPVTHEMVLIPAGNFQMGDAFHEILDESGKYYCAEPIHTVYVSSFRIDKYEMTWELWTEVYDWAIVNGYQFDNAGQNGSTATGINMPVTWLYWYDAVKWLNARSEKEGLTPVYYIDAGHTTVYRTGIVDLTNDMVDWMANGYRLPTEAEWEKADRGGIEGKRYPWGNDFDLSDTTKANAPNSNLGRTTMVGSYPPNGYGLYDMAGNVWEWTWDWWTVDYSSYTAPVTVDPHGSDTVVLNSSDQPIRARRGGAYAYQYLKCADRMPRPVTYVRPYFGFRAVRSGS